eukprot:scaffold3823_cov195-Amphora_coffeaeformis.AAC.30
MSTEAKEEEDFVNAGEEEEEEEEEEDLEKLEQEIARMEAEAAKLKESEDDDNNNNNDNNNAASSNKESGTAKLSGDKSSAAQDAYVLKLWKKERERRRRDVKVTMFVSCLLAGRENQFMWDKWIIRPHRKNWCRILMPVVPLNVSPSCAINSPDNPKVNKNNNNHALHELPTQCMYAHPLAAVLRASFVIFQKEESVENAIKLDGSEFKGRQLKVTKKRVNQPGMAPRGRGRGRGFVGGRGGGGGGGGGGGRGGGPPGRGGGYRGGFRGRGRGGFRGGGRGGGGGGYHPYY